MTKEEFIPGKIVRCIKMRDSNMHYADIKQLEIVIILENQDVISKNVGIRHVQYPEFFEEVDLYEWQFIYINHQNKAWQNILDMIVSSIG